MQVLRTPGALDNVFRTLQTLPGVNATEEFGSRLAVRGGSPDQNLTVMDGVEIHDPYRLFGLTSAFNPEIIHRFELSTGGFSAKYGDRLSSMLLVENRDGTRDERLAGSAALSITDANVVLEGGAARRRRRLVAGHRPAHLLRPGRRAAHRQPVPGLRRPAGQGGVGAGRRPPPDGVRAAQPAVGGARDRRGRRARRVRRRHRERPGVAALDLPLGRRGQSHTVVGYSDDALDLRRRRGVREHQPAFECPGATTSFGTADVVFERGLSVKDISLRAGPGVGGWALTSSRPAPSCIGLTTALHPGGRRRPQSRRRPMDRARKAAPACPTCCCRPALDDPRRRLARGHLAGRIRGCRSRADCAFDHSGLERRGPGCRRGCR